jgi:general secretion pathway protein H
VWRSPSLQTGAGFTLIELLVALAIAGLVIAVSVPASARLYESMQYRAAVRDIISALGAARNRAIDSGESQDVAFNPAARQLRREGRVEALPGKLILTVHAARQLNTDGWGVIRFYPTGGSSGGGVDVQRPGGGGVRIAVDWLVGSVSQSPYVPE